MTMLRGGVCHRTSIPDKRGHTIKKKSAIKDSRTSANVSAYLVIAIDRFKVANLSPCRLNGLRQFVLVLHIQMVHLAQKIRVFNGGIERDVRGRLTIVEVQVGASAPEPAHRQADDTVRAFQAERVLSFHRLLLVAETDVHQRTVTRMCAHIQRSFSHPSTLPHAHLAQMRFIYRNKLFEKSFIFYRNVQS